MKASDEFLSIDTPENVEFDYEIAGIGSRFIAVLVDSLIIVVVLLLVNFVFGLLIRAFDRGAAFDGWTLALAGFLSFAIFWGYYIYFEVRWNGQTPGKSQAGIRVLQRNGTPVSTTEVVIRNLIRIVDFLPIAYGIGVVSMFVSEQSCRLGDLAASTLVVHEREEIPLISLRSSQPPASMTPFEASVRTWPLARLGNDDLRLAQDFLQRRHELGNANALARPILARLITKMELEDDEYRQYDVVFVISTIVKAYGER